MAVPPLALVVTPTGDPTWLPLPVGQPAAVTWLGVQMKNLTVPDAGPSLPDNVAVSVTVPPKSEVGLLAFVVIVGGWQVLNEPRRKLFNSAVVEVELRVSATNVEKHGTFVPKMAPRSAPPSKKLAIGKVPLGPCFGVYAHGDAAVAPLASAQMLSLPGPVQLMPDTTCERPPLSHL